MTVEQIFRRESGQVLASLIGSLGDFDLAEDALQDAVEEALDRWPRDGLPAKPLYRVRFVQKDVWPDYRGNPADVIEIEIFQHWLEKIE